MLTKFFIFTLFFQLLQPSTTNGQTTVATSDDTTIDIADNDDDGDDEEGGGNDNTRQSIMFGGPAKSKEFPYAVRLKMLYDQPEHVDFCGGSLIDPQWVLTAAHCLADHPRFGRLQKIGAILGARVISKQQSSQGRLDLESQQWKIHENYSATTLLNDIALIKLPFEVDLLASAGFIDTIKLPPKEACLQQYDAETSPDSVRFENCTTEQGFIVIGWGLTERADRNGRQLASDQLLKAQIPVLPYLECVKVYGAERISFDKGSICAGGRANTCRGDSGGPLLCDSGTNRYQIGLTSWGDQKCQEASVYSRICHHLDWIEKVKSDFGSMPTTQSPSQPLQAVLSLEEFHEAIKTGNLQQFRTALDSEQIYDLLGLPDADGNLAVHIAVLNSKLEIAQLIVQKDSVQAFERTSNGDLALHLACRNGLWEFVNVLLDSPIFVPVDEVQLSNGWSCLHIAASKGQVEAAEMLIERGADLLVSTLTKQNTPLHLAAWKGHLAMVQLLVRVQPQVLRSLNSFGQRPLGLALQGPNSKEMSQVRRFLLSKMFE